jgi:hypothetical protein
MMDTRIGLLRPWDSGKKNSPLRYLGRREETSAVYRWSWTGSPRPCVARVNRIKAAEQNVTIYLYWAGPAPPLQILSRAETNFDLDLEARLHFIILV